MKAIITGAAILVTSALLLQINVLCQGAGVLRSEQSYSALGASIGINDLHIRGQYLSPDIFRDMMFFSESVVPRQNGK